MGFPRQEYQSGWPVPSPGDLPDSGIKPGPPALQADSLLSQPPGKPQISNILISGLWGRTGRDLESQYFTEVPWLRLSPELCIGYQARAYLASKLCIHLSYV